MGSDSRTRDLDGLSQVAFDALKSTASISVDDPSFGLNDTQYVSPDVFLKETDNAVATAQLTADTAEGKADTADGKAVAAQSTANSADGKADANAIAIAAVKPSIFGEVNIGNIAGTLTVTVPLGETLNTILYIPQIVVLSFGSKELDNNFAIPVVLERTLTSFKVFLEESPFVTNNIKLGWLIDGVFRQ